MMNCFIILSSWNTFKLYIVGAIKSVLNFVMLVVDRLYGLVVSVPGYRSRGPGSIPGATRFFMRSGDSVTGCTQTRDDN
jgi:hypothetical protein